MHINDNGLYFVNNTSFVYQWKKTELISFLKYRYAKCGCGKEIDEQEQGCIKIGSIVVCAVTLQYIIFLLLVLANDIEPNPEPTGTVFVHISMEIVLRTRLDTRLPHSRAGRQGPYSTSLDHLGRGSGAKDRKNRV